VVANRMTTLAGCVLDTMVMAPEVASMSQVKDGGVALASRPSAKPTTDGSRQLALVDGLDCLPGQLDLPIDATPAAVYAVEFYDPYFHWLRYDHTFSSRLEARQFADMQAASGSTYTHRILKIQ
jgi:hypothetical protein